MLCFGFHAEKLGTLQYDMPHYTASDFCDMIHEELVHRITFARGAFP